MIMRICKWALWLDEWLQERLGRPYNFLLGVGLVFEIIEQAGHVRERLHSAPTLLRSLLIFMVSLALLLHQIGALSHHMERHGERRGRGRSRSAAKEAGRVPPAIQRDPPES
jgi:hypothetical protein